MAYKVSVIVELVKDKKKLEKTMEALEGQTLSGDGEIQIILLASKNISEEYHAFCEKYASAGEDNMILLQEADLSKVEGDWINILQEGQAWTASTFETVVKMTEAVNNPIDFILEKYKEETEELETTNRYEYVLNQTGNCQEDLGKYIFSRKFVSELEDILRAERKLEIMYGLASIMVQAQRMIILEKEELAGKRMYEKKEKDWYFVELPEFRNRMMELRASVSKEHIQQVELVYMSQLAQSMKDKVENLMTEEEIAKYELWLQGELRKLEDAVINRANMNAATRRYAFSLKRGKDIADELVCRNGKFYYNNLMIYDIFYGSSFEVKIDEKNMRRVEGISYHPLQEKQMEFYLTDGEGEYPFVYQEDGQKKYKCLNHVTRQQRRYECIVPESVKIEMLHLECIYLGKYVISFES